MHLVCDRRARWTRAERERLAALLRYGEPYDGAGRGGALVVVTPRLGTVSPWASKATDIAHNCGLALRRIERVTEYRLALKSGRCSARRRRSTPTELARRRRRCCTTA